MMIITTLKMLLIDDSKLVRAATKPVLEGNGYDVTEASTGAEALEILQKTKFDLILLDMVMPKMSGLDFLQLMQNDIRSRWTPVLLHTAVTNKDIVQQALNLGIKGYIVKPAKDEVLMQKVKAVIATSTPVLAHPQKGAAQLGISDTKYAAFVKSSLTKLQQKLESGVNAIVQANPRVFNEALDAMVMHATKIGADRVVRAINTFKEIEDTSNRDTLMHHIQNLEMEFKRIDSRLIKKR